MVVDGVVLGLSARGGVEWFVELVVDEGGAVEVGRGEASGEI